MPELRLIDANALIESFEYLAEKSFLEDTRIHYALAIETVKAQPTIEAEPVRHGRWIVHTTWNGMFGLIHSECSECKFDRNGDLSSWKFCPNCGARMDGGADNANN